MKACLSLRRRPGLTLGDIPMMFAVEVKAAVWILINRACDSQFVWTWFSLFNMLKLRPCDRLKLCSMFGEWWRFLSSRLWINWIVQVFLQRNPPFNFNRNVSADLLWLNSWNVNFSNLVQSLFFLSHLLAVKQGKASGYFHPWEAF